MPPEATSLSYTHDAFISYSRRNEAFARELQRALENFKPPKDLNAPQRYLEVFRDKEDFTAGEYTQNLEKNLKLSGKLIVICSPAARASQYVDDEIRRFAQSRGSDHIIPVLFAGIPNNEARPGQEQEMAFPEALCEVMQMPLAVNYLGFDVDKDKVNKGIFSDAWYTTLANVYEVSRSEIEQREKRRRIRARRITFSVLIASVAVLSVLLVFALVSRNQAVLAKTEADTQRNRAVEQENDAKTQRDAAIVARQQAQDALAGETRAKNLAEERRKEAERQKGIAMAKTEEAKRERDIAEQRSKETLASMFDTSAMRNFSEASAYDLRQEIEFDRSRKLKAEQDAVSSGADPNTNVRGKILAEELTQYEDNIRLLRAHARDLRSLGRKELQRADKQWMSLDTRSVRTLVGDRSRPTPPAIFSIEVLNASQGESLILHYGDLDDPRFILIDGGPRGVYEKYIAPRLAELKERFSGPAALSLDLVIVSQSDAERIEGITELTNAMVEQSEKSSPDVKIGTVWFNHPLPVSGLFAEYLAPQPKWRLATNLLQLKIPVNAPFAYHVARPEQGAIRVPFDSGLTITVLNPTPRRLVDFQKYFADQWRRRQVDLRLPSVSDEAFSGVGRELIRPMASKKFVPLVKHKTDRSVVNLASLVLMFEYHGKRFLYTSDANDFQVLEGLHEAGYLDDEGKVHLDVLHIPHYGSDLNVSEEFFKRVIADQYIITGDGKFNNPETATLNMLTKARQNEVYSLQFAHRVGRENLGIRLDQFWESSLIDRSYRRIFRPPDEKSLVVNLLDPVQY
jgi:hypothetical protein